MHGDGLVISGAPYPISKPPIPGRTGHLQNQQDVLTLGPHQQDTGTSAVFRISSSTGDLEYSPEESKAGVTLECSEKQSGISINNQHHNCNGGGDLQQQQQQTQHTDINSGMYMYLSFIQFALLFHAPQALFMYVSKPFRLAVSVLQLSSIWFASFITRVERVQNNRNLASKNTVPSPSCIQCSFPLIFLSAFSLFFHPIFVFIQLHLKDQDLVEESTSNPGTVLPSSRSS